jgi:hypothetical protein
MVLGGMLDYKFSFAVAQETRSPLLVVFLARKTSLWLSRLPNDILMSFSPQ